MSLIIDTLSIYVWFTCIASVDEEEGGVLKSIAPDEVTHDSRKAIKEDSPLEICVTKFISYLASMHYISIIGMYIYLLIIRGSSSSIGPLSIDKFGDLRAATLNLNATSQCLLKLYLN